MGDQKKKDDPCISMGKFELKICEQKPPEKKKDPPPFGPIVVTLTAIVGASLSLFENDSPTGTSREAESPNIASYDSSSVDVSSPPVATTSPNDRAPITTPSEIPLPSEAPLQYLTLNPIESGETLPAAIQQFTETNNFEAIAQLFSGGEYWVGNVKSPLDLQTAAAADSFILKQMETAIAAGCLSEPLSTSPADSTARADWVCPGSAEPLAVQTLTQANTVLITGEAVNIRAQPRLSSEVLTTLSYAILPVNQPALQTLSEDARFGLDIGSGWCPVIVNEQFGYVAGEFCRPILQPHAIFRRIGGQWQVTIAAP
jgi:hypothetical protein